MTGSTGWENGVLIAKNINFDYTASSPRNGIFTSNGQILIGSTTNPDICAVASTLTAGTGVTITNGPGSITISSSASTTFRTNVAGPVVPSGTGQVTLTGTNIFTDGNVANTVAFNLQGTANAIHVAQGSLTPSTTVGPLTNGQLLIGSTGALPVAASITSSDSSITITPGAGSLSLTVTGGTTVGKTITGDSGGALSPTAGNWNIVGLSGAKTSGASSTLTVKSPPYSDVGSSATSTRNTGEFVTAAVTRTLPASAGLADGDLFEYVVTTASALIIQAVGTQKIRYGSALSSAAGTLTSNTIGSTVTLRFRATDGFFYAIGNVGTWTTA